MKLHCDPWVYLLSQYILNYLVLCRPNQNDSYKSINSRICFIECALIAFICLTVLYFISSVTYFTSLVEDYSNLILIYFNFWYHFDHCFDFEHHHLEVFVWTHDKYIQHGKIHPIPDVTLSSTSAVFVDGTTVCKICVTCLNNLAILGEIKLLSYVTLMLYATSAELIICTVFFKFTISKGLNKLAISLPSTTDILLCYFRSTSEIF